MNKAAYKTGAILTLAGVGLYWLGKMWEKMGPVLTWILG